MISPLCESALASQTSDQKINSATTRGQANAVWEWQEILTELAQRVDESMRATSDCPGLPVKFGVIAT